MTDADWSDGSLKGVMVFLNGCAISGDGPRGERVVDDSFLLLFNAYDHPVDFILPSAIPDGAWRVQVDTTKVRPRKSRRRFETGEPVRVEGRAVLILSSDPRPAAQPGPQLESTTR
jgi:glycogen operon protein